MPQSLSRLPIDEVLNEVLVSLKTSPCVVLQAPTGAGKTTRVPPALLATMEAAGIAGQVIVLEPRRIAARAAARRMAAERGEEVGQVVGYQVRFDRKASAKTRILVVTEGIFVRMLQDDPFLEGVAAVVFDEFHERSLQNDVALAMTRKVQGEVREDLKLVVMSATLATEEVAAYLDDCPVVLSEGRSYPVDIEHLDAPDDRRLVPQVVSGIRSMQGRCQGDVLVFLPGVGEIRRVGAALEDWAAQANVAVMSLFGDLSPGEQDAVLLPGSRQKVILSTNVAETSVTIEGVEGVVDAGLARRMRYDVGSGLNRLELVDISQASAAQRAGRAGRMGPGRCLRLWTAAEHQQRPRQEAPELRHVDLAATALELLAWGETDLPGFPWLEPPPASAIDEALGLLKQLGAIEVVRDEIAEEEAPPTITVTPLGQLMAALPVHPRLSRLILAGGAYGCLADACLVAALLSERDPFQRPTRQGASFVGPPISLWERLHILKAQQHDKSAGRHLLKAGAARFVWQAQKQLVRLAKQARNAQEGSGKSAAKKGASGEARLAQACLAAFPDRVARRRHKDSHRALMANGQGVCLFDKSVPLATELCVCLQLDAGRRGEHTEAIIRQMLEIDETQLPEALCDNRIEVEFDRERAQVMAFSRRYFQGLLLKEKVARLPKTGEAEVVLAAAASEDLGQALDLEAPDTARWLARVRCLGLWMPTLELPTFDDEGLQAILPQICAGRRSFEALRKAPLLDLLKGSLTYQQRQSIEQHAPERIKVPSGSHVKLDYAPGEPPVLAVRIQEVFGWADTPTVAGGRVPVLLHLLAPNRRPQQITQDLRSFWESTYTEVRKELRQRYPRHAWPEDPWNAPPERRPKRRRR